MPKKKNHEERNTNFEKPAAWLVDYFNGGKSSSGQTVTEKTALGLSALFCGVRAISEDLAGLPLKVYKRAATGKEEARTHPLWRILHDSPNEELTAMNFWETLISHAILWEMRLPKYSATAQGVLLLCMCFFPAGFKCSALTGNSPT